MQKPARLTICAASIAAFLIASPDAPGNNFAVNLGDTQVQSGLVAGPTGLTLTGGGTLVLTNAANSYTGVTTIRNGSIVISNPSALGFDASAIVVTGFNPTIGQTGQVNSLRGFGGGSLVLSGLTGGMTLTRDLSLQGQGPIADRGAALISIGNNTLSGAVTLNQPAFGTPLPTTVISAHGTLTLAGPVEVGGTIATTLALLGGVNQAGASSYHLTGPLSGTGTLVKLGGGTLWLNPSTSAGFSGSIRTSATAGAGQSTVRLTAPNVLGTRTAISASSVLDLNGGILEVRMDAPSVLAGGSPAHLYGRSSSTLFADRGVGGSGINGTVAFGQLAYEENLTFTFSSRNGYGMSFGTTPVQGGNNNTTFNHNFQGGLLTFTGNFWRNTDNTGNRTFTLGGNGDTRISGDIVATSAAFNHSFTKAGTGTLTVTGTATTLDGDFNIQNGAVATHRIVGGILGTGTAAGTLNLGTAGTTGTLNFLGAAGTGAGETLSRSVNLAGTTGGGRINANQAGSAPTPLIFSGPIASNTANKTLTLGGASTLENEIQSALPNPVVGGLNLAKTDPGTWVLSGQNLYTGTTTISNGTLKLKANGSASTILNDVSPIVFNVDATQAAGGRLLYSGFGGINTETVGVLSALQGHGTVSVASNGATTTLLIGGLGAAAGSIAASVNFDAPTSQEVVTLVGASGFVRGSAYFNGANFAYGGAGSVLRAPVYGADAGFVTTFGAPLTSFSHNEVTGSFPNGGATVSSLKISGSQTLTLGGLLAVNGGFGTVGGVLVDGGNAVIAQGGGGAISQGLGAAGAGGGALVIRVNQATDSLALEVPITSSTTQGLGKNGLGTLILSAANNQSGATSINEGTVRLAPGGRLSAANQGLAIRQGATLDLNGVTQPGNTIGAFNGAGTVTNGSANPAELAIGTSGGGGTFSGVIQDGLGRVTVLKQSTGTIPFTGLNTYTGSTTIAATGTLSVTNLTNIGLPSGLGRGDATSDATNADSLVFTGTQLVSGATGVSLPGALAYTGTSHVTTDRLFRLGGNAPGAGARIQASGANSVGVVFSNTAPIGYTPAGAGVAQNLVLSGASTADNRIDLQLVDSGVIGGSLRVNKIDAGKWVLGNPANSYTGATKINGGVLEIASPHALPTTSPLLFGGTLAIPTGGVIETSGTFTRAVSAGTVANTVNFNANGNFPGSGGFAASGDQLTVNLGGAAAPLTWGAGGFLMPGTAAATLRLNSTTALGEVDFQNPIDLGLATTRTVQVDDNGNTGADFATLSGVLSGSSASLNKTGVGTLSLTGANTYDGATIVTAGTLVVRSLGDSANPGPTSVGSSIVGNTDSGAVLLGVGAVLQYVGPGEISDRKIRLSGNTTAFQFHSDGSGPLTLANLTNDISTSAKTLSLRGTNAAGNRVSGVLTDSIFGTALSVAVDGSATWILSAANIHSGNTTVSGGALGIGNDAALGTGTLVLSNGNIFASGADRTISNPVSLLSNTTIGFLGEHSLTFTAPLTNNAAANSVGINNNLAAGESLTFAGMTMNALTGNRVLTVDGPNETVFNGPIVNPGTSAFGLGIAKTGTGLLVLNTPGSNFTQNGASLDIDNGTVRLDATNAIPSGFNRGGVVFSPDNGQNETATLNLNGFSQTINSVTGTSSSASTIDNASGSAVTLTLGADGGTINTSASITNSGGGALSLRVAGGGTGTLSGPQMAYTGTTTLERGVFLSFTGDDPEATTGIAVNGDSYLGFINGVGSNFSALTSLSLGDAVFRPTGVGLDVGTVSDTLAISGTAVVNGDIGFEIGAAPGFGGASTYTLLSAAGGGLISGGATYFLNGNFPGGYIYSLTATDTAVTLNLAATPGADFYWRGDIGGSWTTYPGGDTNWVLASGSDPGATPGPLDTVIFSDTIAPPNGPAVITRLDIPVAIDSLRFNGSNTSTSAARVSIAPGSNLNSTLTLAPANPANGIEIFADGGTASITAPVVLAADQTWSISSVGAVRPELVVTGVLSGTGHLTKTGGGTATITGNNTRTGRTNILGGTVQINSEAALGAAPAAPTADQLTLDGPTARLRFSAATLIDDANRGILLGADGGSFDTTDGNGTIASVISGLGVLRKIGTGNLILTGANTYSGGTTIGASVIRVGSSTALGTGSLTVNGAGTIVEFANGVVVANDVTVAEQGNDKAFRLVSGAAFATLTGDISVAESTVGSFRAQASAGSTLTFAGNIATVGTAAPGLRVNELAGTTGVLVLAGANTYSGITEVRGGTLRNGASEVVPGALTVNAFVVGAATPSTATYDLAHHSETVSALTFGAAASSNAAHVNIVTGTTGTLTLAGDITTFAAHPNVRAVLDADGLVTGVRTITVADAANQEADLLLSGNLAGVGGIIKAGAGTAHLTGAATYSGATTINQGTLRVSGSISGAVVVNAGGALGGTGAVGAIDAGAGVVSPGASIGTLTASALTMSGSSTFQLEIDTTNGIHDLLSTNGPLTLSLSGTPLTVIDLGGNFALTEGTRFRFLSYSGGQTGLFSFGGNPIDDDIESFVVGANAFAIDYNDLGGTAVALVVVPEPGIAGSLFAGAALLAGLRRTRREA